MPKREVPNASSTRPYARRVVAWLMISLVASMGVAVMASPAAADPVPGPNGTLPEGWVNTEWGPMGPTDRALIEGVRKADLWEGPAGQMAVAKGQNARVKEIGAMISNQHLNELDPLVRDIAKQLNVNLPSQPSDEQLGWLKEMEVATGADFDRVFVDRLRLAHSKVFQLIATVRANTRNTVVRGFAQTANRYVDTHMTLLDSTTLVDWTLLPTPGTFQLGAAPAANGAGSITKNGIPASVGGGLNPAIIWTVIGVALVAGLITVTRVVRPR